MIFDPDAGRSVEDIIQRKWDQEWPEDFKACVRAEAEARGCQWWDVVMAEMERFCDRMLEDSALFARLTAREEQRECPYGLDPLFEKERHD